MTDWTAKVARTAEGLDHLNTLTAPLELRRIVIAQGKQFQNGDPEMYWTVPELLLLPGPQRIEAIDAAFRLRRSREFNGAVVLPAMLRMPAIPLVAEADGTFTHVDLRQGVVFSISVINTKDEFVRCLDEPDLHLIYYGHARYGRGPCFGSGGSSPGEEWEEGHGPHPNSDGIFRMGHRFVSVHAHEVLEHGYTANLVRADFKPAAADCDPDLKPHLGRLKALRLEDIDAAIRSWTLRQLGSEASLVDHVRDRDPDARWWTHGSGENLELVMHAGWTGTISAPDELGALEPACRVFCHLGCSSFVHNYAVVRKQKGWKRSGNERYAYWTTAASAGPTDVYWLQALLTYPKYNAWESWAGSLDYALRFTNAALAQNRHPFRVI